MFQPSVVRVVLQTALLCICCVLATAQSSLAQNTKMGSTYRSLQALASTIETRFEDGCVATTIRQGNLYLVEAHPADIEGKSRLRLSYNPQTKRLAVIDRDGAGVDSPLPASFEPELDWLNVQACALVAQRAGEAAPSQLDLRWSEGLLQPQASPRTTLEASAATVRAVLADFPGVRVTTVLRRGSGETDVDGQHEWESTVTDNQGGAVIGRVRWFPVQSVLALSFPQHRKQSLIGPSNLGRPFPFVPNIAWGTVQAFAFHHFLQQRDELLRRREAAQAVIAASFQPRLKLAQQGDGCTGLWYLNDTLFRPCCDAHDNCYTTGACSAESWWSWQFLFPIWDCAMCNAAVVVCFFDTLCTYMGMGIPCMMF